VKQPQARQAPHLRSQHRQSKESHDVYLNEDESASRRLTTVQRHPVSLFFALTYAVSWSLWTPLVIFGDHMPGTLGFVLTVSGSLVPSTVGILIVARLHGKRGVRTLLGRLLKGRVGLRWYLAVPALAVCLPRSVSALASYSAVRVPSSLARSSAFSWVALSIFPGSALGEELGWRGLALPRLQSHHSALRASLIVGAL
jgi:membrane protease YdiL (CAAX protease family)